MREYTVLDYLAIFDPGHMTVVSNVKRKESDHQYSWLIQHGLYQKQVESAIKFNLLWKPHVTIRHVDLFNNLALMRFLLLDENAAELCSTGRIRITTPDDERLSEKYKSWAFGGKVPQHFHHLSPKDQARFDNEFRKGGMNLEKLQEALRLDAFQIDIKKVLARYDACFCDPRYKAVLSRTPDGSSYASDVRSHWHQILSNPSQLTGLDLYQVEDITKFFESDEADGWRRKQMFTGIEALESRAQNVSNREAFAVAKIGAINQAFYDDFARIGNYNKENGYKIAISRDITYLSERLQKLGTRRSSSDSLSEDLGSKLGAVREVPFSSIMRWHLAKNEDSRAFVDSVETLYAAFHCAPGSFSAAMVEDMVSRHINIINACVAREKEDEKVNIDNRETWIKTRFPNGSLTIPIVTALAISEIGSAVNSFAGFGDAHKFLSGAGFAIVGGAVSYAMQRHVLTESWKSGLCALGEHIETTLGNSEEAANARTTQL